MTTIYKLPDGGSLMRVASYSLPPKKALVAYIKQEQGDFQTWKYPEIIQGMRESESARDHWYFDFTKTRGYKENAVIAAYPDRSCVREVV